MANNTIIGLKKLRENIDEYIAEVKKGRSFIVVRKSKPVFKLTPLDVWGDDGLWETVINFKKIKKSGVPIGGVISALKRLHAQNR